MKYRVEAMHADINGLRNIEKFVFLSLIFCQEFLASVIVENSVPFIVGISNKNVFFGR